MCGTGNGRYSEEFYRRRKPENHAGCGVRNSGCGDPSRAYEGTPLWDFEQKYGKIVTEVTWNLNESGRKEQKIVKKICPKETDHTYKSECCSLRYRVSH